MRRTLTLTLLSTLGLGLAAQTPAAPAVKWRGAFWASAAASDRQTEDGSLFLRSTDAGDGQLAVDGLQWGADVTLPDGWSMKFTLLAGQTAKALNAATLASGSTPAETGSIAWPEASIAWTGAADTLRFGRMYTAMGMEVLDGTQDTTASRGLLFTYAVPFAQVGVNWHHAYTTVWSSDVWVYNGEDRLQDNNHGKTVGLGLTYNHGGAADKFVNLMAFSGAEQDGLGAAANSGAEGRKRNRLSLAGQWVWGKGTLNFEVEKAQETFLANFGTYKGNWGGVGAIYKYQYNESWAAFGRAEYLSDDTGARLSADPTIGAAIHVGPNPDLQATSFALGAERRWHATFTRLEARVDNLNHDVKEAASAGGKVFRNAASLTWSLGTSF